MPKKTKKTKGTPKSPNALAQVWLKPALPEEVMIAAPYLAKPWLLAAMRDGYGPADGVAVVVDVETKLGLEIAVMSDTTKSKTREQATRDLLAEIGASRKSGQHVLKSSWFDNESFGQLCTVALAPDDHSWKQYISTPPPLGHMRMAVVVANAVRFGSIPFDVAGGN
jgi:hypothetical protein